MKRSNCISANYAIQFWFICLLFLVHWTQGLMILRPSFHSSHLQQLHRRSIRCEAAPKATIYNDDVEDSVALHSRKDNSNADALLNTLQQVPPGALSLEQAELLRNAFLSSSSSDETPRIKSELFLRMILEFQASKDATVWLSQPTLEQFVHLFQQWEDALPQAHHLSSSRLDNSSNNSNKKEIMAQAAYYTQQLFTALTDLYQEKRLASSSSVPFTTVMEQVMRILSLSRAKGMDRTCRDIFDNCSSLFHQSPTLPMYHALITALSQSRDKGAAHRAETFLKQAVELFPPTVTGEGITIDTFNVVMTAWAKSGFQYGPERAEKLIYLMDELDQEYLGGKGIFRPSVSSFTSLLDAYAQTLEWDSVGQAERIFNRLLDEYLETGQKDLEPNVATWTIVLSAWAKLSRKNNRGAAPRANRLLERMESLYKEGRISFGPDAIVYISTMNAWAFSKSTEGPQRATDIILEMYERYLDGDDTMKPSAKNIRVVLEAWIASEEVNNMEQAEKLLDGFVDHLEAMLLSDESLLEAVSDVYRTMLFGWSKRDKPRQAYNYLLDMVENNMNIDSFCFDRIIETNTRVNDSNAMARTQEVFDLMNDCRIKGLLKPDDRVYSSYIRALVKAAVPDVASKTYALLNQMKQLYSEGNQGIQPTVFTYNAVLMACAATAKENDSQKRAAAFKIAISVFNELRNGKGELGLDHVSFGNLLQCANLLSPSEQRESLIRSTFGLCCKSGFVNSFVLRDFQAVASDELWIATMKCSPDTEINADRLPVSWRRMTQPKRPAEQGSREPYRKTRR